MPSNVRNFLIDCDIDGRKSRPASGPRSKDGGFTLRIRQRHRGVIHGKSVRIEGSAARDGTLTLTVETPGAITELRTKR